MQSRHISIKFCGGCNSRIDRGAIAKWIKEKLTAQNYQISFNRLDADFVIYLSGCTVNCAQRYGSNETPCITVAGVTVDASMIEEGKLIDEIMNRVSDSIAKLEKRIPE